MAISFRAATAGNSGSAAKSAYTVTLSASIVAGDFLLGVLSFDTSSLPVANPSGWTQQGADIPNHAASQTTRILTKTAVAGDIGAVVTATPPSGTYARYAFCVGAYTGPSGLGEITISTETSASTSHVTTALSSMAASGSWAVDVFTERSSENASWSTPAGLTARASCFGTVTASDSMLMADSNGVVTSQAAKTSTSSISTAGVDIAIELLAGSSVSSPGAPTSVTAVAGDSSAVVSFTPGSNGGDPTVTYTAISTPGSFSATATSSPVTVAGLTNGTGYTFIVRATNTAGHTDSSASGSVTPAASAKTFIGIIPMLGTPPPPVGSTGPILGVACPGTAAQGDSMVPYTSNQEAWNQTGGVMGLPLMRNYNTGMPTTWASSTGGKITGPTKWIVSAKPTIASINSGASDAVMASFAAGIPAGAYVTFQHEPEQKSKGILPTPYGTAMNRAYNVVKAANPSIKFGPIVMTYTSNSRPVDTLGHATLGHNEWLEACLAAGMTPDFVGYDGYPYLEGKITNSDIFPAPYALAQGLWPGVEVICCETGQGPDPQPGMPPRAQFLVDTVAEFKKLGITACAYFDINWISNGGPDFILNPTEAAVYSGLQ